MGDALTRLIEEETRRSEAATTRRPARRSSPEWGEATLEIIVDRCCGVQRCSGSRPPRGAYKETSRFSPQKVAS